MIQCGEVGPLDGWYGEIGYCPNLAVKGGDGINDWLQMVYQWHRESFTLQQGAKLFARGEQFENQAFRYGPAYGIQFHPEVTRLTMHRWVVSGAHRFTLPGAQGADEQLEAHITHAAALKLWVTELLNPWLG